jgi:hypothetical protein
MVDLGTQDFWKRLRSDPAQLAAEVCTVDVVALDETLQKHPALRAWVNAAHEVARIAEERLKWELTKTRAVVLLREKKRGPNKTVSVLEAEVDSSVEVEEATNKLLAQQEVRVALRAMANALEDRKDMLIQIAAKQRKELEDYR